MFFVFVRLLCHDTVKHSAALLFAVQNAKRIKWKFIYLWSHNKILADALAPMIVRLPCGLAKSSPIRINPVRYLGLRHDGDIPRYSCTYSSVIFPVNHAPLPIAQKWLPQQRSFNSRYSFCNLRLVLPSSLLTIWLIDFEGGYSKCIWTWLRLSTPLKILMASASQIWIINCRHRFWMRAFKKMIPICVLSKRYAHFDD